MMIHKQNSKYLILSISSLLMISCISQKDLRQSKNFNFTYNYCEPTIPYVITAPEGDEIAQISTWAFSVHDQLVCVALGISKQMDSLSRLKNAVGSIAIQIRIKEAVILKVLSAQSQIQAVAAELDCEGEWANQAAIYLDGLNSRRNNALTAASITLGALTTVGSALISEKNGQAVVGITGGLISAGLAALTIKSRGKGIKFYHQRNLLRSIWSDTSRNTDYPYFVWRMLHEQKISNAGNITLAESIRQRWRHYNFNDEESSAQISLLFGQGGTYYADDLHTRGTLINQLQATIRSLNQDLEGILSLMLKM